MEQGIGSVPTESAERRLGTPRVGLYQGSTPPVTARTQLGLVKNTVSSWKQPRCPSTEERIKKMWCMYTTEYYSAIKKNEIMPFAVTWMDPEVFILSKSERERQITYDITYTWNLKYDANELINETETDSQTENRLVVAKGWWRDGVGDWG